MAAVTPAQADIKEAARKLHDQSNSALVGIKGLLKIDVTRAGQPAGNQEAPIWGNGLVIGDGIVVAAYQTLVPDVAAQVPAGVEVKTKLNEIKAIEIAADPEAQLLDDVISLSRQSSTLRFTSALKTGEVAEEEVEVEEVKDPSAEE